MCPDLVGAHRVDRTTLRRVFRIGVILVGEGFVRLYNRTSDRTVTLTPEQEARWRAWMRRP